MKDEKAQEWPEDKIKAFFSIKEESPLEHLLKKQKDLDPEFVKIVDKHFWDLL